MPQYLPCKSRIFISRSPTFCSWTWSVIQKLLINEEREVMQQTNSSAQQHLAMGQPNSIQAAPRKSTGQRWRPDLLIEEVNKSKCYDSTPILPYNFYAAIL